VSENPDSEREAEARVRRIMTDYNPGRICPAGMWWQVWEALGPREHVTETLESFSPELKAMIRDSYRGMRPGIRFRARSGSAAWPGWGFRPILAEGYRPAGDSTVAWVGVAERRKFLRRLRPTDWLFSGWNWVAAMLPLRMLAAKGSP